MNNLIKFIITAIALSFIGYAVYGIYHAGMLNYFQHASFITSALLIIAVISAIAFIGYYLIKIWKNPLTFIVIAGILQACSYAKSNQQVVISTDCGSNWEQVVSGESIPKGTGNYCFMKVVMPNFPMQGESNFIANLQGKVKVSAMIDYDYQIINALSFIKQAKYLGSANAHADGSDALDPAAFEAAENTVIEKRIRDVAKKLFALEDIVEMDPTELENNLLDECNTVLDVLGVKLNFITLTFIPDEQTRQAIDVATAMRIYESKGLKELGKEVISARASATKIVIQQPEMIKSASEE